MLAVTQVPARLVENILGLLKYLQSMCSDCVDEAGDTPRDDEDDEVVSAIAEVPAAIDDPWARATDGERFPWRLWSIRDTTWVTGSYQNVMYSSAVEVKAS